MSILIKSIDMPKDEELLSINIYPDGKVTIAMDLKCKQIATAVSVPPTADVRENVHATFISEIIKKEDWKGQIQSYYQPNSCSNCHVALTGKENFCTNCGAEMRKNSEDNTKTIVKEENNGQLGKE